MSSVMVEVSVAVVLFGGLLVAFAIGSRLGRDSDVEASHVGVIQGATLGLIGLLTGFCFSGALGRFVERQDLLIAEANAIGTAWLRADLLPDAPRDALKGTLVEYARVRADLFEAHDADSSRLVNTRLAELQRESWSIATGAVEGQPALANLVLSPLNEAYDLLSVRNAAVHRHMPALAVVLVLSSTILGACLLGYGQSGRRLALRVAAISVVMLIGGIVWTTIDLDFPQRGVLQISVEPLRETLRSIDGK